MAQNEFTPRDFFALAKEAAEHEAELRIRLAKAGVIKRDDGATKPDETRPS